MQTVSVANLSHEVILRTCLQAWAGHWRGSLEDAVIADTWSPPKEGETFLTDDRSRQMWKALTADEDGWFRHDDLGGGWDEEGQPSAAPAPSHARLEVRDATLPDLITGERV